MPNQGKPNITNIGGKQRSKACNYVTIGMQQQMEKTKKNILDSLYSTTHSSYGDLNPHEFLASMKATDAAFLTKTRITSAPSLEI